MLMTAHHAGGILSAYVALWAVEPLGWRAAFWICVTPLLFVPVLAKFMPESLSFLVAKGRLDEASQPARRFDLELPAAAEKKPAADRWNSLADLFRGGEWTQTLLYWVPSFGGLLLVHGVHLAAHPDAQRGLRAGLRAHLRRPVQPRRHRGHARRRPRRRPPPPSAPLGRGGDPTGAPRISAIWFALTAAGVFLLSVRMPLGAREVVDADGLNEAASEPVSGPENLLELGNKMVK